MAIDFYPQAGQVLICDFNTGFQPPEMVKKRPVVIISKHKRRGPGLVTIVPLSTTRPEPIEEYHHSVNTANLVGRFRNNETWAKCDMVMTVATNRLDRMMHKGPGGSRLYHVGSLPVTDIQVIREKVAGVIGLTLEQKGV